MALKLYRDSVARAGGRVAEISATPASAYMRLAVTLPHIRANTTDLIDKALDAYIYKARLKDDAPLAIPCKSNPANVVVYPNIKCKWTPSMVADHLHEILANERTKVRLENPQRAARLALRREHTTLARVLAEHTNLYELGYKDDAIRDAAERIVATLGRRRVVVCATPEDCYTAFKCKNGSCMTVGSGYFGTFSSVDWVTIAEETGIYPSVWYLYQPYAKLCYLEVGGLPMARFLLYRTDLSKDEWPCYGDIKAVGDDFYDLVVQEMTKLGKEMQSCAVRTIAPYRVPAVFHKLLKGGDVPHCPIANCDFQIKDFTVVYDDAAKEFLFDHKDNQPEGLYVSYTYDYRGFISAEEMPKLKRKEVVNG